MRFADPNDHQHVHYCYKVGERKSLFYYTTAGGALHAAFEDPSVVAATIICDAITLTATRAEYERHFINGERWKAYELFRYAVETR